MGEVFKARHVHLNAFRCIKVMKQGLLADDLYRSRFLREARLATQIHHPNIAVVHDFFLGDHGSYMVTEFIDGTTVRQWSASYGRFPLPLAADVATQVLAGLEHIHRRGLLHRDISSDNVMLSYDGDERLVVKIIDLGIAKDVNTISADKTQAGMLIGNPKYMSPEQLGNIEDHEQLDGRADLYCLGVVLYEMLLGVPPFQSQTPQGYIVKHLTEQPARFQDVKPDHALPQALEGVIFRALEKNRNRRFADAREFANALQPFLSASAGTLTRGDVTQIRSGPDATMVVPIPQRSVTPVEAGSAPSDTMAGEWKKTVSRDTAEAYREFIGKYPDAPDITEAKARLFELALLETVRVKEKEADREALKRLAEAHPPGSLVGNAVREALARIRDPRQDARDEEAAFQRAWEDGSSAAWRVFCDAYRSSPRAARARKLLDEANAFEAASSQQSDTGLRQFLKQFPDGRHHLEAEIRLGAVKQTMADTAFEQAKTTDTYAAMRDFLARFPAAGQADEAKQLLEERLAFETAAVANSEDAWEDYLAKWSGDRHAAEARARCDGIRAREDEAYRAAAEEKTAGAWEAFMEKHPDSRRYARAERNRRETVAFEKARGAGRAAVEDFLRSYSDGLLVKEARRILRQLADDDDFAHARSLDKPAAWSLYLTTHPGGAHADEARALLAAAEDVAFAKVVASKDPVVGTSFMTDFPDSPRREQVSRLVVKWMEVVTVQAALDAIARGDANGAESLLGKVTDADRRSEIVASLDALRDRQSWEEASSAGTASALRAYVEARPTGRWVSDARKRLSRLESAAQESEPRDWDTAWEVGSVAAWDAYLALHPESPRLDEARIHRHEAVDFDLAGTTNTVRMWRAFIKAWPEGRHRLDAEIRLRACQ
jgi:serine/threonine protein kinase/outer membrane protein assembly factor BamD (BamD/ComL family)